MKPNVCYKVYVVDEKTAKEALKEIVKCLGLGFHPDTLAEHYVNIDTGDTTFEPFEAENFDTNLEKCCEFIEIYTETIELWAEFGMINNETYEKLSANDHSCYFNTDGV